MDAMTILKFWFEHNDKIIFVIIALFLLTWAVLIVRGLSHGDSDAGSADQLKSIEESLKKVLSQTPVVGVAAPAPSESAAPDAPAPVAAAGANPEAAKQVFELTEKVTQREKQIETLKKDIEKLQASASTSGAANPQQEERIKELEGRLAEYEIIEDDIADLSLFKEENARLKAELEKIKAGGAGVAAAPAAAPATATPTAAASGETTTPAAVTAATPAQLDDVLKQFSEAVDTVAPVTTSGAADLAAVAAASAPAPAGAAAVDPAQAAIDAAMAAAAAEVASAPVAAPPATELSSQDAIDAAIAAAAAEVTPSAPAPVAAAPAAAPAAATSASLDPAAPAATESETPSAVEESLLKLDTDKMISEVESLSAAPASEESASALEDNVNTDKLLAEADAFGSNAPAVEGEDDLLGEFKDLQKESGT